MKVVTVKIFITLVSLCFFNCVSISALSNHSIDLDTAHNDETITIYIRSAISKVKHRNEKHFLNYDAALIRILSTSRHKFSRFRFTQNSTDADYGIELVLNQYHCSGSWYLPFISLSLIPGRETIQDLLFVNLYDKNGYLLQKYQFSDVRNIWTGLVFLPVTLPLPGIMDEWEKLLLYAYNKVYYDIVDGNIEVAVQ
ncbi:MAG: hypothetical protein GXY77_12380 [Fibrobacter sp.]|nr:hypothetical protein [Fibrobacter sp.]